MNDLRDKLRLILFGKELKRIRKSLNLSQDEVAANCDITKPNLSNIENGKKDFVFTTLLEIARGLGIEPKELLNIDFGLQEDKIKVYSKKKLNSK